ncbi:MAG: aminotransferase class V-fold PLP-dependent enzyme [Planctomycetota bacterium]
MLPPPLDPPQRLLLGPGPSVVEPAVLAALAKPVLGHLDPRFVEIMDEVRGLLRPLFGTKNEATLAISGTGSAGMETCLVNLIEPGDEVLVGIHGVFGTRMAEVARRAGATVHTVEAEWGRALELDALADAARGKRLRAVCVVHAETSTGVLQPLDGLRAIADAAGAFLVVDCVTSLAGVPVELDRFGVDAAYAGTQKCLSCPPGLAPVSFSERALEHVRARATRVQSWYLDLTLLGTYWGAERAYHHTAPISMIYGLHEAARRANAEGLAARCARHRANSSAFWDGIEALGLELAVAPAVRLPPLTAIRVPGEVDEASVRKRLLTEHSIEIGGGLGPLAGKIWRVGLMGAGSTRGNVETVLVALAAALGAEGAPVDIAAGLAAVDARYRANAVGLTNPTASR